MANGAQLVGNGGFLIDASSGAPAIGPSDYDELSGPPTGVGEGPGGWVLSFEDLFEGTTLDTTKWSEGFAWGTNDTTNASEYIVSENIRVEDGLLRLIADSDESKLPAEEQGIGQHPSGAINTGEDDTFLQQYGYFEAAIMGPKEEGFLPAFWSRDDTTWPPEIDFFELFYDATDGSDLGTDATRAAFNIHYPDDGVPGNDTNPKNQGINVFEAADLSAGLHVYGCLWTPSAVRWYVDGTERASITDDAILSKVRPGGDFWIKLNIHLDRVGTTPPEFEDEMDVAWTRVWAGEFIAVPSNPAVDATRATEIDLSWIGQRGQYAVFRAEATGSVSADYTEVVSGTATIGETYTDDGGGSGLEHGEEYFYRVRNLDGDVTGLSAEVSAVTNLPAPTNLTLDTATAGEITASWTRGDTSPDGTWTVYRSGAFGTLGTAIVTGLAPGTTAYTDATVTGGETYYYTVRRITDHAQADSTQVSGTATSANQVPTAAFTFSPTSPTTSDVVSFDAASSSDPDGSISTYEWDFENDGTTDATGVTASHTYATAGNYVVSLTVTDNDGATDTTTQTITVSDVASPTVYEGFEAYAQVSDGYTGTTGAHTIGTDTPQAGAQYLEYVTGTNGPITSLADGPARGATFDVHFRYPGTLGTDTAPGTFAEIRWAFQDGNNHYSLYFDDGTAGSEQLLLQPIGGGTRLYSNGIPFDPDNFKGATGWGRINIAFDPDGTGVTTMRLYDPTDTQVGTGQTLDDTGGSIPSSGKIGWLAYGDVDFDSMIESA